MPDTRSASRWIGAFEPCASPTRRTIPASSVDASDTGRVAAQQPVEIRPCPRRRVPPADFATGRLSPVSMTSSTDAPPSTTVPSTGTASPARTTEAVADDDIGERNVERTSVALDVRDAGLQAQQAFDRGRRARACARASSALPSSTSVMIAADASK